MDVVVVERVGTFVLCPWQECLQVHPGGTFEGTTRRGGC